MATDILQMTISEEEIARIATRMWEEPILPAVNSNSIAHYVDLTNSDAVSVITTSTSGTGDNTVIQQNDWGSGTMTIVPNTFTYPTDLDNVWVGRDPNRSQPQAPSIDSQAYLLHMQTEAKIRELENRIHMLEAIIREHIDRTKPLIDSHKPKRSVIIEED